MRIKINGRARENIIIVLRMIIFFLTVAAIILGAVCLILNAQFKRVTVEAGDGLLATDIMKSENAAFGNDFDPDCLSHPGAYYFTVSDGKREITVRLKVVDTQAPEITVKNIFFAIEGSMPSPEDFIDTVLEADSFKGEFVSQMPKIEAPGNYEMQVRYTDASGNKTEIFDVVMTLVYDTQPPVVKVEREIEVYVGESAEIDYGSMVSLSDNCVGDISLDIDPSEVDTSEEGEYYVYFTATDQSSNRSERVRGTVRVILPEESAEDQE